jgi:hypothetical protein
MIDVLHRATRVQVASSTSFFYYVSTKIETDQPHSLAGTAIDAIFSTSWAQSAHYRRGHLVSTVSGRYQLPLQFLDGSTIDISLVTRVAQLRSLPCGYSLLDPCSTKAKEAQKRSATKACDGSSLGDILLMGSLRRQARQDANAMAVRRLVLGTQSYASNTTISRVVEQHDHHGLFVYAR